MVITTKLAGSVHRHTYIESFTIVWVIFLFLQGIGSIFYPNSVWNSGNPVCIDVPSIQRPPRMCGKKCIQNFLSWQYRSLIWSQSFTVSLYVRGCIFTAPELVGLWLGGRFCSTCNVCRTSENGVISVIACYPFSIPNLTRLFLIVSLQPCASRHITISKE